MILLLLAACSDTAVGKFNGEPSAAILSHEDGDTVLEGATVTFSGSVSDPDDVETDLAVTWSMNGVAGCEGFAEAGGGTSCDLVIPDGSAQVLLAVHDPDGAAASEKITLDVIPLEAPVVRITMPHSGARAYTDQPLELAGTAVDADDAPEHLSYTWTADSELAGGTVDATGAFSDIVFLPEGNQTLTVTVTDDDGNTADASVGVIVNGPDTAPTCTITSPGDGSTTRAGDDVLLQGSVVDAEEAEDALAVTWSSDRDGTLSTAAPDSSGSTTATTTLSAGTHVLTLAAVDEVGLGCSDTVVVTVGSPPTISFEAPLDGDVVGEADLLDLDLAVTDPDSAVDAVTVTLSSDIDGILGLFAPDGSGEVAWSTSGLSLGEHTLTATATDPTALSASTSVHVTIDGTPTAPTVSISPSSPTTLDELVGSATGATDPEGDPLTYTWEWWADGTLVSTGTTIPASDTTRGETWELRVSASDGVSVSAEGSASVVIRNSAPTVTAVGISPASPTTVDTLSAAATSTDDDGDAVSFTYAWYVNGGLAGTGATLAASASDKGDSVYVTATPTDGIDSGAALTSSTVVIANTAPTAPTVTIDPAAPLEAIDDLYCEVTAAATDADSDSVSYSMTWTQDGVAYAGTTTTWPGDTVPAAATAEGQLWVCTATPTDGGATGTAASDAVTIGAGDVDYSDTWTLDRTVSYSCAFGLVTVNVSTMRIADSYPDVDVTVSGNPGTMSGTFPTVDTIDVAHALPGTCTETYTMAGTFVDENTFDGSFTATFAGSCFDCTTKSWIFTATR